MYTSILLYVVEKYFHENKWIDITAANMYTFLGILLKLSIYYLNAGVYPVYVSPQNKKFTTGSGIYFQTKILPNTEGFALKCIKLYRLRQI